MPATATACRRTRAPPRSVPGPPTW
jgi:hypothetical protein